MTVRVGSLLVGIGVVHQAVGVVAGWPLLSAMARDGLIASVGSDMPRVAIFWFLAAGVFMIGLGALIAWIEAHEGLRLPTWLGWFLVAVAIGGGAFMPVSGFWLALVPGVLAIMRGRHSLVAVGGEATT